MSARCRPSWAIVALGLVLAGCGSAAGPNSLDLTTPGANTGAERAATPPPNAVPDVTPEATPGIVVKPVTKAEKQVVQAWSDKLRHGRVSEASRYFAVPAIVVNPQRVELHSRADVEQFNRELPCGAKLIRIRRGPDGFVVGSFRLTERPGSGECGNGTGQVAVVAFLIEERHIAAWFRLPDDAAEPTPTPTPTATATPSPTATATPSATASPEPTETVTPVPTNALGMATDA